MNAAKNQMNDQDDKALLLEEVGNKSKATSISSLKNSIDILLSLVQKDSDDLDMIKRII